MAFWCLSTFLLLLQFGTSNELEGFYCGTKGLLNLYTTQVKTRFEEDSFNFRVDGDMHVASCHGNGYSLKDGAEAGVLNVDLTGNGGPAACFLELMEKKTNGKKPEMIWDQEKDTITLKVHGISIVDYLGSTIDILLDKKSCNEKKMNLPRMHQEL